MFKYVYILVSEGNDNYTEQALISIHSLRKHNNKAYIVVLTDQTYFLTLSAKKGWSLAKADEIIRINTPENLNKFQRSRFIKTNLRQLIRGDFIYIDVDTVITGSLKSLETLDCSMGAVLQQDNDNWSIDNPHFNLIKYNEKIGASVKENYGINIFINSGVLLCRDTEVVYKIFEKWHDMWLENSIKHGFHWDQPSLWRTNQMFGNIISILPGEYNCQAIYPTIACKYLINCKIFHYSSTSLKASYLTIKNKAFLSETRDTGITKKVEEVIDNIRNEYLGGLTCIDESNPDWFNGITPQKVENLINRSIIHYRPSLIIAKKLSEKLPFIEKIFIKIFSMNGKLL